jgi:hypothetical protein
VAAYLEAADEVFEKIQDLCGSDEIESRLKGAPARSGFTRIA